MRDYYSELDEVIESFVSSSFVKDKVVLIGRVSIMADEKLGKDIDFESFESSAMEEISVDKAKDQEAASKKVRDEDA